VDIFCHGVLLLNLNLACMQDAKKTSHRGFGFVTFSDEGAAERVALRTHEILGHQVRILLPFTCSYKSRCVLMW
jgi:uracil DNA glycosylase